jgi:hypothetical protein
VSKSGQNKGPLKIYELNRNKNFIALLPFDESAIITYKDGKKQKREFTYGSSFLSQSGRYLSVDANMKSITVRNNLGGVRTIEFAN